MGLFIMTWKKTKKDEEKKKSKIDEKQEEDEDYGADSFDRTPDTSQDHSNARKEFNTKNKLHSNASSSYSKSWYPFNSYFTSNLVS